MKQYTVELNHSEYQAVRRALAIAQIFYTNGKVKDALAIAQIFYTNGKVKDCSSWTRVERAAAAADMELAFERFPEVP